MGQDQLGSGRCLKDGRDGWIAFEYVHKGGSGPRNHGCDFNLLEHTGTPFMLTAPALCIRHPNLSANSPLQYLCLPTYLPIYFMLFYYDLPRNCSLTTGLSFVLLRPLPVAYLRVRPLRHVCVAFHPKDHPPSKHPMSEGFASGVRPIKCVKRLKQPMAGC